MLEAIRGISRMSGGVGGVRDVLGTGRECRYSRVRRSKGSIMGHWGSPGGCRDVGAIRVHQGHVRGVGGVRGVLVAIRECR